MQRKVSRMSIETMRPGHKIAGLPGHKVRSSRTAGVACAIFPDFTPRIQVRTIGRLLHHLPETAP